MQSLMTPSMRSSIEGTARDERRIRLNGTSDIVGGFNCIGVAVVLGTDPSHGLRHTGLCAHPRLAMCPAPSLDPGEVSRHVIQLVNKSLFSLYILKHLVISTSLGEITATIGLH
jgi:hypothetical protein